MLTDLQALRDTLRQRLRDGFRSYAMADWVLSLVMPDVRKTFRAERERLAWIADDLGADELAAAIRSGKPLGPAGHDDPWTHVLPFAEA